MGSRSATGLSLVTVGRRGGSVGVLSASLSMNGSSAVVDWLLDSDPSRAPCACSAGGTADPLLAMANLRVADVPLSGHQVERLARNGRLTRRQAPSNCSLDYPRRYRHRPGHHRRASGRTGRSPRPHVIGPGPSRTGRVARHSQHDQSGSAAPVLACWQRGPSEVVPRVRRPHHGRQRSSSRTDRDRPFD